MSGERKPDKTRNKLEDAAFLALVGAEVRRVDLNVGPILNRHHAYGVLAEEVAEFFDEVRKRTSDRAHLLDELVQIACVCCRAAKALRLGDLSLGELAELSGRAQGEAVVTGERKGPLRASPERAEELPPEPLMNRRQSSG